MDERKTATAIAFDAADAERRGRQFERTISDFVLDFAPEDRRRMAEFQARITRMMREVQVEAQQDAMQVVLRMAEHQAKAGGSRDGNTQPV